ncbi:MAG TPA: hypothetical protein VLJ68_09720 [Chitinophagaceae bacterium]|nr:hypothetical protein [Chitinophagaceae bacterium]
MKFQNQILFLIISLMMIHVSSAQKKWVDPDKQKGHLSISWGWNRAVYTKSNIIFKGDDYDFILFDVVAHDHPSKPISLKYLIPKNLTLPQTNLRISYFIKDNLALCFADDHMKYVMDQDQTVDMKGTITRNGNYKGVYDGKIQLTSDFLTFEHTDGLSYINFELEKYYSWHHSKNNKTRISGFWGGGTGFLFPRTNVRLLDYERSDRYHIAGFGLSAKAGIQVNFFRNFIIKAENKLGYINMPDIKLHKTGIKGRGEQDFCFAEWYITFGVAFDARNKEKRKRDNRKENYN